ncbi:biopolymer transporter ExbD [Fusobacterium perfoetens]|uniref:ExbD/TolR family protein n=1 Tax=Fusobacterium perfoetens TaxID=852 RepID=UPI001F1662EF|nr:biopolymer transporter ExbD [Fusobacterium perfoetens]MCF2625184.1 biopolymer transporter ExbD [Fusobacterium perfoetens]
MKLQRLKRRNSGSIILEMTPLIDVVFLLLIFFLVATSFEDINSGIKIDLPQSTIREIKAVKELQVDITKGKTIYVKYQEGNERKSIKVTKDSLKRVLADKLEKSQDKTVIISGDKALDYGFIVDIMTISKEAGASELDIDTMLEK